MKKFLALLLSVFMVISFAACKGGEQIPTGDGNGTGEQQGSTETNGGEGTSTENDEGSFSGNSTDTSTGNSGGTSLNNGGGTSTGNSGGTTSNSGSGTSTDNGGGSSGNSGQSTTQGPGYATARTLNKSGAVSAVDNLANTYYKLTTEKKLNIAYFGGSVTGGTGGTGGYCWASATTDWLKAKFPSANITETNVAWGGTSSFWGYFRMDEDNTGSKANLVASNPDLVFIEFSINDIYAGIDQMQSTYYMEGIVKKLRAANPKVDIVIVFVTDKSRQGTEHKNILGHQDVAAHYGIPTINVGNALVSELNKTGNSWDYYMTDIVHPNNKGYKIYADCIAEYLNGVLVAAPNKSGLKDHAKPTNDLVSNATGKSEIIPAGQITDFTGFKAMKGNSANCPAMGGNRLFGKQGDKLTVQFEGKGLGFLADGGNGGKVKITVAGKSVTVDVMGGNNFEYVAIENLQYGKYTAEVEIVAGSKVAFGAFLVEK